MNTDKRVSQASYCGWSSVMDGEVSVMRCVDCGRNKDCAACKAWKWFHGPLPPDCPLPRVAEEESEEAEVGKVGSWETARQASNI